MNEVCGDNRFEIIAEYKKRLIEGTNIESSPEEMAVIDSILFRFWQMGWLPIVDVEPVIRCRDCKNSFMCDPGGIRCTKILNNGKYMSVEGDFFCAYGAEMDAEPPKEKRDD